MHANGKAQFVSKTTVHCELCKGRWLWGTCSSKWVPKGILCKHAEKEGELT